MISVRAESVCILSLICLAGLAGQVSATYYTFQGSLAYGNGLYAENDWANNGTTLSWTVTYDDSDPDVPDFFYWHYSYTLTVPEKGISHAIIEASNGVNPFTTYNIYEPDGAPAVEIQEYHPTGDSGANPHMPADLYGIKFEGWSNDPTSITVSFYSDRVPVWGNFYAKDGNKGPVLLYNTGFSANDIDPDTPAGNGSLDGHLLVPDTVPEPSLLTLLGLGGLGLLRKKRGSRIG